MSEMVEQVARAMEARAAQEPCTIEDVARAAIEAMREPTAEMIEAEPEAETDEFGHVWDKTNSAAHAKAFWQAMIAEALKD